MQLEDFDLSGVKLSIQRSVHAAQRLAAFDLDAYRDIQRQMRDIENTLSTVRQTMQSSLQTCREEQEVLAANRRALEAGKKTYPKKLLVLKQELEERLYQQVGKPVEVCILADLFSIQEEAWTNAIEGYIHNQKLNLVVEAEYFMDAYRIYRSIKEAKKDSYLFHCGYRKGKAGETSRCKNTV